MNRRNRQEVSLTFRHANLAKIKTNPVIVIIGKRNTGKSVMLIQLLYHMQDIPMCVCISPTEEMNNNLRRFIPNKFIHYTYSPEVLSNFLKRQKLMTRRKNDAIRGRPGVDPRYRHVDPRGILVMDDCLAEASEWKNDPSIRWLFMNGRHANAAVIMTLQYVKGILPALRSNVDYIFLMKETKRNQKRAIYDQFAGMFPTFSMFEQVFNQMTRDYGCMMIDNTTQSDKVNEQVFYSKANLYKEGMFRTCYDEYWVNNDDYLDANGGLEMINNNEDEDEEDYNKFIGPKIVYNATISNPYEKQRRPPPRRPPPRGGYGGTHYPRRGNY